MTTLWSSARLMVGVGRDIGTRIVVAYAAVNVASFVGPFVFAIGLRPLVDGIARGDDDRIVLGGVLCGIGIAQGVFAPAAYRWSSVRLRERAIMVMQRRVLDLASEAPRLEHFERPDFADRLQLVKRSSEDLVMGLTIVVVGPVVVVQLALTATLLARLDARLVLLPVLALPSGWLNQRAEGVKRAAALHAAERRRSIEHLFFLSTSTSSAMETRIYALADELLARHADQSRRVHAITESALWRALGLTALGWSLFAASYVGAVLLCLRGAADGRLSPGDVALTLGSAAAVVSAAGRLTELAGSLFRAVTSAGHYRWLEDQALAPAGQDGDRARSAPPARLERGIELEGVSFAYAGDGRSALDDVTLSLSSGSVVAVVGENGAGKTTLVKLLSGMYAPTRGRITLDGVDLARIDVVQYRARIAAGFQDFVRFELRARESIGVGEVARIDDDALVRAAMSKAGASFADRLAGGLDTQLGRSWEGGVELSGGEWQKLALARSFMREDPLLLIFDEPTASLDPQTEHALFEQVASDARSGASDGRITVLISHRFSTVRMADLIVVLDDGRVVEQGDHDALVRAGRLYAELYELQARSYR